MKENQKDTKVTTGNQSGQQIQGSKSNQGSQVKSDNLSQKPSTVIKGEKEMPEKEIERPSREHQHDYKTPVGKPIPKNENQDKIRKENTGVVNKNESSKQVAEHKS